MANQIDIRVFKFIYYIKCTLKQTTEEWDSGIRVYETKSQKWMI